MAASLANVIRSSCPLAGRWGRYAEMLKQKLFSY